MQVGHCVRAAVAHRHDGAIQCVVALDRAANQLFPQPGHIHCSGAAAHDFQPLAIGVVGVGLTHAAERDAGRPVLGVPLVRAVAAAEHVAVRIVAVGRAAVVDHRVALGQRATRAAGALGAIAVDFASAGRSLERDIADAVVGVGLIIAAGREVARPGRAAHVGRPTRVHRNRMPLLVVRPAQVER